MAYIKANFGRVYKLCFFMSGISNLNVLSPSGISETPTYLQADDWSVVLDSYDRHGIARHVNA